MRVATYTLARLLRAVGIDAASVGIARADAVGNHQGVCHLEMLRKQSVFGRNAHRREGAKQDSTAHRQQWGNVEC